MWLKKVSLIEQINSVVSKTVSISQTNDIIEIMYVDGKELNSTDKQSVKTLLENYGYKVLTDIIVSDMDRVGILPTRSFKKR